MSLEEKTVQTNIKDKVKKSNILGFDSEELKNITIIPAKEYTSNLRQYLPQECLKPVPKQMFRYFVTMGIYLTVLYGLTSASLIPVKLLISIVMGITLASLTFFLHDLMHGSILKSNKLSYIVGLTIGIFNLFPPLFWKRVHNLHHSRTGNSDDPDRSYIFIDRPKNIIEKLVYKTRISSEAFHPLISILFTSTGFIWYFLHNITNALFPRYKHKDYKYNMTQGLLKKDGKPIVVFELITIFSFQVFLFSFILQGSILNYFLASILPILICHFGAMLYIHTNHFLSPLTGEIDDPLINSLSLRNLWIIDKIFYNFSHHVEHHLFPAMSSVHFPKVRELLLEHYPQRYQLMPMKEAVKLLFNTPRIHGGYTYLISSDGSKRFNCLLPSA